MLTTAAATARSACVGPLQRPQLVSRTVCLTLAWVPTGRCIADRQRRQQRLAQHLLEHLLDASIKTVRAKAERPLQRRRRGWVTPPGRRLNRTAEAAARRPHSGHSRRRSARWAAQQRRCTQRCRMDGYCATEWNAYARLGSYKCTVNVTSVPVHSKGNRMRHSASPGGCALHTAAHRKQTNKQTNNGNYA